MIAKKSCSVVNAKNDRKATFCEDMKRALLAKTEWH
jgi:hypothetical protein